MIPFMKKYAGNIVVFYDKGCADGELSAVTAHMALAKGANIRLVPIGYGKPEERMKLFQDHIRPGDHIMFVDTAPLPAELAVLRTLNERPGRVHNVTIIDHHLTSYKNFHDYEAPGVEIIIDRKEKSAAALCWKTFFRGRKMPELYSMVGKMEPEGQLTGHRDYQIAAYIDLQAGERSRDPVGTYEKLLQMNADDMAGKGMFAHYQNCLNIDRLLDNVRYTQLEIEPGKILTVPVFEGNVRNYGRLINQALTDFSRNDWYCPGVALMYFEQNDEVIASIRTIRGKSACKTVELLLEQKLGLRGGGHERAAVAVFAGYVFHDHFPLYTKAEICAAAGGNYRLQIPVRPRIRYADQFRIGADSYPVPGFAA